MTSPKDESLTIRTFMGGGGREGGGEGVGEGVNAPHVAPWRRA